MRQVVQEVMTVLPIALCETSTVQEAALAMREADVGAVLVVRDELVCGILTDRDIVVRTVADGVDPTTTFIGEIYSTDLVQVEIDDPIDLAVEVMRDRVVRRLPVVDDGRVVGVVSLGDLACVRDPQSALAEISAAPANT